MRDLDSVIFSAILRRSPTTLMSSTASLRARPDAFATCGPRARKASMSSWLMRPAGPVPATCRRSMPASLARSRTAGDASGFSPSGRGAPETDGRSVAFRDMAGAGAGFALRLVGLWRRPSRLAAAVSGFGVGSFAGGSACRRFRRRRSAASHCPRPPPSAARSASRSPPCRRSRRRATGSRHRPARGFRPSPCRSSRRQAPCPRARGRRP